MLRALLLFLPSIECLLLSPRTPPPALPLSRTAKAAVPRAAVSAAFGDAVNLRAASVATLASLVLMTSPMAAHAKGGGHGGGGGHSSSHSSHSSHSVRTLRSYHGTTRSSRRSSRSRGRTAGLSSSSSTHHSSTASPPPPIVLYPDKSAAQRESGFYCPANLPRTGERVNIQPEMPGAPTRKATVIASQQATHTALYGNSGSTLQPVPGFESDCSVTVQYDDGTTETVSAAEQPLSASAELAQNVGLGGAYLLYGALVSMDDGDSAWDSALDRQDDLLNELAASNFEGPPLARPVSGDYWGASDESDEGDQAVRTTLAFNGDGTITGRGIDGVDGSYRITSGRWGARRRDDVSNPTVVWTEVYDEGFEVAVEGRYDESTATIKAAFTSSRGVRGRFKLKPKPSVFW